ncbi:MAG TPA: acyl-CoA synthetase [Steroidobacteraceae bacterium]|nr:acyl-CoA synthetase [Steroidobacteraceae bacterium]
MSTILSAPWRRLRTIPRWHVPAFYNVAEDACDRHPADKLAMVWDDDRGTSRNVYWGELQDLSSRIANALTSLNVATGDRVVMVLAQSPETAAAILAVLRSGATLVTISELLADRQIHSRIAELQPKVLITESRIADRFATVEGIRRLLLDRFDRSKYSSSFTTVRTPADSPAFIAFTSGTTGPAKGVILPHRVMLAGDELSFVQDLRDGELFYGIGDWSWWVRKILGPWQHGAVNLAYKYDRYDPGKLLQTLARHGVTNAFINATAIRLMMRDSNIGRKFPQRFRVVSTSNEPLGVEAFEWFREQFDTPPLEFYGCTEVGIMIGASPHLPVKAGSMGTAIPGWHVRVLDEQGREALPGTSGEVCLLARSNPNYPLGYWCRPEESQRDFGATWFHTKDIAYADEDGYFWYVGRKDDVIKAAGYRVGPHEVEATLRRHPMVLEAAVIGVPDATRGARIVAYVALPEGESGSDTLADELRSIVREEHSAFAYPKEVHFVRDLPRSSTGKIDRATLRRRYGEAHNA